MKLQNSANGGGLSHGEQQARLSYERMAGRVPDNHHVIVLSCCGTSVEVPDFKHDYYGTCPRPTCGKRYVVLGNNNNPQVKSEAPDEQPKFGTPSIRITW